MFSEPRRLVALVRPGQIAAFLKSVDILFDCRPIQLEQPSVLPLIASKTLAAQHIEHMTSRTSILSVAGESQDYRGNTELLIITSGSSESDQDKISATISLINREIFGVTGYIEIEIEVNSYTSSPSIAKINEICAIEILSLINPYICVSLHVEDSLYELRPKQGWSDILKEHAFIVLNKEFMRNFSVEYSHIDSLAFYETYSLRDVVIIRNAYGLYENRASSQIRDLLYFDRPSDIYHGVPRLGKAESVSMEDPSLRGILEKANETHLNALSGFLNHLRRSVDIQH